MRLIDAEKLIALSEFYETFIDRKSVETAPNIEAIPIEFIEEYIEYLHAYCKKWEDAGFHNLFIQRNLPIMEDTLKGIIDEWRRINGQ